MLLPLPLPLLEAVELEAGTVTVDCAVLDTALLLDAVVTTVLTDVEVGDAVELLVVMVVMVVLVVGAAEEEEAVEVAAAVEEVPEADADELVDDCDAVELLVLPDPPEIPN